MTLFLESPCINFLTYLLNAAVRITSVVVRDVQQSSLSITAVKSVPQTRDSEPSDRVLSSGSMYTAVPGSPGAPGAPTSPRKPCQHHTGLIA